MSKIVYFCSPDFGHAEPTLMLVKELIRRGHEVIYYGFDEYREYIENTGASYISCDKYLRSFSLTPRQILALSEDVTEVFPRLAEITLAMDQYLCDSFTESRPDCIIADTAAIWGKAIAIKLKIPYVCSMTSFALNRYSSRLMRATPGRKLVQTVSKTMSMRALHKLQENGYPIQNMNVLLPDDGISKTLVFSSRGFHPASETFSDNYQFVGFQLSVPPVSVDREASKLIYISMGCYNNMKDFYRVCVEAFRGQNVNVVMSTARSFPPNELGTLPGNIYARSWVDQKVALQNADLFICPSGMSSVNESLYFGVPMLLFPQTTEQRGISRRVVELKCGTVLHKDDMITIRNAAQNILENDSFRKNAAWVSDTFRLSGGGEEAADIIEQEIRKDDKRRRKLALIAAKKQAARDLEEAKVLAKRALRREKEETEIEQEMALAMEILAESVREIESQLNLEDLSDDPEIAADVAAHTPDAEEEMAADTSEEEEDPTFPENTADPSEKSIEDSSEDNTNSVTDAGSDNAAGNKVDEITNGKADNMSADGTDTAKTDITDDASDADSNDPAEKAAGDMTIGSRKSMITESDRYDAPHVPAPNMSPTDTNAIKQNMLTQNTVADTAKTDSDADEKGADPEKKAADTESAVKKKKSKAKKTKAADAEKAAEKKKKPSADTKATVKKKKPTSADTEKPVKKKKKKSAKPAVEISTSIPEDVNPLETIPDEERTRYSIFGPKIDEDRPSSTEETPPANAVRYSAFTRTPVNTKEEEDLFSNQEDTVRPKKKKKKSSRPVRRAPVDPSDPDYFKKAVINDLKTTLYRRPDSDDE